MISHPRALDCDNFNHRRSNAPVGYCPQCGERVNERVRAQPCTEAMHALARRQRDAWCVHCGETLRAGWQTPSRA